MVMTTSGLEDLRIVKLILYLFEGVSCLEANFSKTCLYSSKLGETLEVAAPKTLNCVVGSLPITYLGLPISGRSPCK